ncbi:collagen alpha-1(I) chain-like [Cygnus olor]|uniref:collagen alpha-1(I) chain-like n=1 Tax=Cygnus olor TaxID=8869 RepID=UPI001ADE09E7|nr:collagen alpha-1(I) chain-like [Cygnus olor]
MGNSIFVNCCRHVTDLIFQTRSFSSPDERSPLLPKPPTSRAGSPDVPEASRGAVPYPDVIPSTAAVGSLQKRAERIQDSPEAKGEEAAATACDNSCWKAGSGAAGPLQRPGASCAAAVLPADLEEGPAGPLDRAALLEACQSHVKPEDGGSAAGPGAARAVLPPGPRPGPGRCVEPAGGGRSPRVQQTVAPPGLCGEKASESRDTSAGAAQTDRAAGPGGRLSGGPSPVVVHVLPARQPQKRRRKKKLPPLGAHCSGAPLGLV